MKISAIYIISLVISLSSCGTSNDRIAQEYANNATRLLMENKYLEADTSIKKAISLKPNISEYYVGHGFIQSSLKQHSNAKRSYETALKLLAQREESEDKVNQTVFILLLLNKTEEAKKLISEKSETLDPSKFHYSLVSLLEHSKSWAKYALPKKTNNYLNTDQ